MSLTDKLRELHPRRFFLDTWRQIDLEAEQERDARRKSGLGYDAKPLIVFALGAVLLALMEYFGHRPTFVTIVDWMQSREATVDFARDLHSSSFFRLYEFVWWSAWRVLGFFLGPVLIVKLLLRERVRDYGLSTQGFVDHAWIYVLFFAIVLVCVLVVSRDPEFNQYYPFYRQASRSWFDFVAWELLYAAQFFSLEFFFRGFWLKAGKTAMGSHVIFAMTVPYCMIHFGKPFVESLAAIIAGIVLGTLAMKTRSIWSGFLIHVSVAVSMDLAALSQNGGWPETMWPIGF